MSRELIEAPAATASPAELLLDDDTGEERPLFPGWIRGGAVAAFATALVILSADTALEVCMPRGIVGPDAASVDAVCALAEGYFVPMSLLASSMVNATGMLTTIALLLSPLFAGMIVGSLVDRVRDHGMRALAGWVLSLATLAYALGAVGLAMASIKGDRDRHGHAAAGQAHACLERSVAMDRAAL